MLRITFGETTVTDGIYWRTVIGGRMPTRAAVLVRNLAHNNEDYGNIVGFFRGNNLLPPSSENQNQGGGRGN